MNYNPGLYIWNTMVFIKMYNVILMFSLCASVSSALGCLIGQFTFRGMGGLVEGAMQRVGGKSLIFAQFSISYLNI